MKESKAFTGEIVIEKRNLWTRFKSFLKNSPDKLSPFFRLVVFPV